MKIGHIEALEKQRQQIAEQIDELSPTRGTESISVRALKAKKLRLTDKINFLKKQLLKDHCAKLTR